MNKVKITIPFPVGIPELEIVLKENFVTYEIDPLLSSIVIHYQDAADLLRIGFVCGMQHMINKNSNDTIQVKAEFLFELSSKRQWINRCPAIIPPKIRRSEQLIWLDKNGNVFELGADFDAAEKLSSYPCKVYRLRSVSSIANPHNPDIF